MFDATFVTLYAADRESLSIALTYWNPTCLFRLTIRFYRLGFIQEVT